MKEQNLPFYFVIAIPLFNAHFHELYTPQASSWPVVWSCRIHRLLLFREVKPHPNECTRYDTKQSDSEVPVMLALWGMWSTTLLPSLSGPL